MVSAVSGSSSLVSTGSSAASPTAAADKALNLLLQNTDVQQYLAEHTSTYLPVTTNIVLSTLWAAINVNSSTSINENDLYKHIVSLGGSSSDVRALWLQMAPPDANGNSKLTMNAADFAFDTYLTQGITSNLGSLQTQVTALQQQQGPDTKSSLFSTLTTFGGSDIGSGQFIDVFV